MDYVTQMQLRNQFKNLERALNRKDKIAARFALDEINRLKSKAPLEPDGNKLIEGLPRWVKRLIEDKGVRLTEVEKALHAKKIVVAPTFGKSGTGAKLEIRF